MWNIERPQVRKKSSDWPNSSSVSPGKPTMRSVVTAQPGKYCRSSRRGIVPAVHPLQDGIRAGLQTQVELRAEIGVDAERLAEVLVDGARLQRAQADPDRGDRRAERRQQLPQAAAVLPLPAPGGDLDAVDDDLAVALGGKALRLLHRGLQRHGAHPAAGIGDDAVGAEIVAPVLDL